MSINRDFAAAFLADPQTVFLSTVQALKEVSEERDKLRGDAESPTVLAFLCPICAHDAVDVDQCCSSCGADSYIVAKADAEDIGRRLKSLAQLEDLLVAWVEKKRSGHRWMSPEEKAIYDAGVKVVDKRKASRLSASILCAALDDSKEGERG